MVKKKKRTGRKKNQQKQGPTTVDKVRLDGYYG